MPKKTLSKELEKQGFRLMAHYDDLRAGGRHRHKLIISKKEGRMFEVPECVDVITTVDRFIPNTDFHSHSYHLEFIYYLSYRERGPAIGTPFQKRVSQAYKRRIRKGISREVARDQIKELYFND